MWALTNSDNTINEIITRPKQLIIGDTQYPRTIFNMWSKAELSTLKIYEVITDNSNFKDEKWYINTNQSFAFANDTVTASYGSATAKAHADTTWSQDDEDAGDLPSVSSCAVNKVSACALAKADP